MNSDGDGSDVESDGEQYGSLDRTLEVTRSPSQDDLLPELECPVCFDLPLPPIRTCVRGHIICDDCCCKLDKCPLCQQKIDAGRNFFAENYLNRSTIKCKFKVDGCPKEIQGEKMKGHIQNCKFRPLRCKRCSATVAFSDFESHMFSEHGVGKWDINDQGVRIAKSHRRHRSLNDINENSVPLKFIFSSLFITAVVTILIDSLYASEMYENGTVLKEERELETYYAYLWQFLNWSSSQDDESNYTVLSLFGF